MKERKNSLRYALKTKIDPKTGKETDALLYKGKYYAVQKSALPLVLFLISAMGVLGYFLQDAPSTKCIYVFPFAAIALFPLLYFALGAVRILTATSAKSTEMDLDKGVLRVMKSALGSGILCCITMITIMVYSGFLEMLSLLLLLASAAASFVAFALCKRVDKNKEELHL